MPARIRVRLHGDELRVANTGSALTAAGVAALSSLRASAKRDTHDSVGHFGVGFTAVLSWSRAPRVVSTTGGVRFDAAATATEIAARAHPALDREVALRTGQVAGAAAALADRPDEEPPPDGYRHRGAAAAASRRRGPRSSGSWPTRQPPRTCSGR